MVPHLHGEDLPGGHVVAEAEPAGNTEDLESIEHGRRLQQAVDVERLGRGAGRFKGEGRFLVAVRAGGSENQDMGSGHG